MIHLNPRQNVSPNHLLLVPVLSVLLSIGLGGMIFAALGYNALEALYQFFVAPLLRADQIGNLFVKACPLIIIGTGLVFCYRANIWNIGAEGQLIFGALGAGWIALYLPESWHFMMLPLMILGGMIGGALLAAVPILALVSRGRKLASHSAHEVEATSPRESESVKAILAQAASPAVEPRHLAQRQGEWSMSSGRSHR